MFLYCLTFFSCFSFRLSQKEIDAVVVHLPVKPVQNKVIVNGRAVNYAEIGNDSLPVAFFVLSSPWSWIAFIDFMKDTILLEKVKNVSVDRIGFGYSEFGECEKSLAKHVEYLLPIVQQ